jgi:hypothetical protein
MAEASLHGLPEAANGCRQQGRHDAASAAGVKSKMPLLPLQNRVQTRANHGQISLKKKAPFASNLRRGAAVLLSILCYRTAIRSRETLRAQEEQITAGAYEREELGVNQFTALSRVH